MIPIRGPGMPGPYKTRDHAFVVHFLYTTFRALTLLALPQIVLAAPCETGVYRLWDGYPTANIGECHVVGPNEVVLRIKPEIQGEINPSPWYGFHVRLYPETDKDASPLKVTLEYEVHAHRYWPKVRRFGGLWQRLPEDQVRLDGDRAVLVLEDVGSGLYISAQEILDSRRYDAWIDKLDEVHREIKVFTLGYSSGRRPIRGFNTNSKAEEFVLVLGRQHPPEVTGGRALMTFVDTLLFGRDKACEKPASNACRFYDHYDLIVIPLMNPDGVALGHWRLNLKGVDLNRDWGPFTQPETTVVAARVQRLVRQGRRLRLMLDFHSTNRSLIYTQMAREDTDPPGFAIAWAELARELGAEFAHEPRPQSGTPNAKNYFFDQYGVPSITYEVADEADTQEITQTARAFAVATAELLGSMAGSSLVEQKACEDLFCHMGEVNMASLVMLEEEGLLSAEDARQIGRAIEALLSEAQADKALRSSNYLDFEAMLVKRIGPIAANVHMGRSRQDVHGASRRMFARSRLLAVAGRLVEARELMIELAEHYADTPVPAYTHGVQSQPTTLGHQFLAFSAGLERDFERLMEAYDRLNLSPLGAAAGSSSGFRLNRHRLAELLGFSGPVENTFDANFVSSSEFHMEIANALELSAVTLGQFAQNIHTLYHDPDPWIFLDEAGTSGSTIMPQKRSPRALDRLRSQAGQVIGDAQTVTLMAHNTSPGMHDYRQIAPLGDVLESAEAMYERLVDLLGWLRVDKERALEELNQGYSMMTEVADALLREAGVPFRSAHAYAKALTDLARETRRRVTELTDRELVSIYSDTLNEALPLETSRIRDAFDPARMVAERKGYGGPQADEMKRMIARHKHSLSRQELTLGGQSRGLFSASNDLQLAFNKLIH